MKCNECGQENAEANSFCIKCGQKFNTTHKLINQKKCNSCGSLNSDENKYCVKCGDHLDIKKSIKNAHTHKNSKKRKSSNGNVQKRVLKTRKSKIKRIAPIWIIISVIFLSVSVVVLLDITFRPNPGDNKPLFEPRSSNPVVEANVYDIASKFICSCGKCGAKPLDICTCNVAVEERIMIREYLENGQTEDDIVKAVANRYGWLKGEHADQYKIEESKIWQVGTAKIDNNYNNINDYNSNYSKIATYLDRESIIRTFKCPCGQCRIDELIDCDCNHNKGATEVKKFISDKISEGKYTVSEIISIVDDKYVGKK